MEFHSTSNKTAIVYGAYINAEADWQKLIRWQLGDLRRSGLLGIADLYIVVSNPAKVEGVSRFFSTLPLPIKAVQIIEENKFEYPAIARVWELANTVPEYDYIAYLHTKGMSYAKSRRDVIERALTANTFFNWKKVLAVFSENPGITKVGLFPAEGLEQQTGGWVWFNFWWARSSYIRALSKPEETLNRYYYEEWLSHSSANSFPTPDDCYSLFADSDVFFSAEAACDALRILKWKQKYGFLYKPRSMFTLQFVKQSIARWRQA